MTAVKRITAITGTRADYDLLFPVLTLLEESPDFELSVLATGAHLSREFGSTINEVRADGWGCLMEVPSLLAWDEPLSRLTSMSTQLAGMARVIEQLHTDLILLLGDREEPLLGATIGTYLNIPVVHIFGGDSGYSTPDDQVRHAVSLLSDLHFTVTDHSRERVISLGISPERVVATGNPGLDRIRMTPAVSLQDLEQATGCKLASDSYLVVTFHPLEREHQAAAAQMEQVLTGALATGLEVLVNSPNSDSGNYAIRSVTRKTAAVNNRVHHFSNLPRKLYVNLMRNAACLVGNSSAGILEAPFLRLPVVNAGERQRGREHTGNVHFTECDSKEITAATRLAIAEKQSPDYGTDWQHYFGDGKTAERILTSLAQFSSINLKRQPQQPWRDDGS